MARDTAILLSHGVDFADNPIRDSQRVCPPVSLAFSTNLDGNATYEDKIGDDTTLAFDSSISSLFLPLVLVVELLLVPAISDPSSKSLRLGHAAPTNAEVSSASCLRACCSMPTTGLTRRIVLPASQASDSCYACCSAWFSVLLPPRVPLLR
eukprot:827913-Rhodomonas_salina.1